MKIKINTRHIIPAIICMLIIILSGGTWVSISTGIRLRHGISLLLYLLLAVILVMALSRRTNLYYLLAVFGLSVVVFSPSLLIYRNTMVELLKELVVFTLLIAFLFYCREVKFDVWKCLYTYIKYLSVIAVFFWTITNILQINIPHKDVALGRLTFSDYFGIFSTCSLYHIQKFGMTFYRLQSIFWEPGVFGVALNYATFYYLFVLEHKKPMVLILFVVCTLLTLSTTALCVGMGLIAVYWYINIRKASNRALLLIPIVAVAGTVILMVWLDKMLETNMVVNSYFTRMSDITVSLRIWKEHFWLGTGYRNEDLFLLYQGLGRKSSNGFMTWVYTMGLVGLLSIIFPFIYNIIKSPNAKKVHYMLLFALFVATNMTEPLKETPFMLLQIGYAYYLIMKRVKFRNG